MYRRPNDQYKDPSFMKGMIEQLQKEKEIAQCKFTTVRVYRRIPFQEVEHAGTLTHHCSREKGHEGKCKCKEPCGIEWQGWE